MSCAVQVQKGTLVNGHASPYRAVTIPLLAIWIVKCHRICGAGQTSDRATRVLGVMSRHTLATRLVGYARERIRIFGAKSAARSAAAVVSIARAPLRRLPAVVTRRTGINSTCALHVEALVTHAV
jgi:hypothetical protein